MREDISGLLRRHPIFSESRLDWNVPGVEVLRFPADSIIGRAGAERRSVLALIDGGVALSAKIRDRQLLAALLGAPSVLGDDDHLAGAPWSMTMTTTGPTTVVSIPNAVFDQWLRQDPSLALGLYRSAARRAVSMRSVLTRMLLEPTERQILALLWDLSRPAQGPGSVAVAPLSQAMLSRSLGVDRKTISRNLQRLSDQGMLVQHRRQVSLLVDRRQQRLSSQQRNAALTWRLSEFRRRAGDEVSQPQLRAVP